VTAMLSSLHHISVAGIVAAPCGPVPWQAGGKETMGTLQAIQSEMSFLCDLNTQTMHITTRVFARLSMHVCPSAFLCVCFLGSKSLLLIFELLTLNIMIQNGFWIKNNGSTIISLCPITG
jgi:hypothetical protein